MTEQELRDKWQKEARACATKEDLIKLFDEIAAHKHDYGSIVVGCGAIALAAAHTMNRAPTCGGGITGFQAGCVMWEFVCSWTYENNKCGLRLIDYDNLCYPQYKDNFTKPSITKGVLEAVQKRCKELLKGEKGSGASDRVVAHWKAIAAGGVPFGLEIRED
jgi:hypothetical protein